MIKTDGYFLLHRSLFENPTVTKDADYFITWIYILSQAEWKSGKRVEFGGRTIELQAGQFTTGVSNQMLSDLKKVNNDLNISKLNRVLKKLKIEKQIEQRTDHQCSLFTVLNWEKYQLSEQRNEQRVNNDRTTSEQRVNTNEINKERNKGNKGNKKDISPYIPLMEMIEEKPYSDPLKEKLKEWLKYKSEKKQGYKQTGFKAFLSKVDKELKDKTEDTVIDCFDNAMSHNWSGVYYNTTQSNQKKQAAFDEEEFLRGLKE